MGGPAKNIQLNNKWEILAKHGVGVTYEAARHIIGVLLCTNYHHI